MKNGFIYICLITVAACNLGEMNLRWDDGRDGPRGGGGGGRPPPIIAGWTVKNAGRTVKNRPKADFLLSGQHITKCKEYHSEKVFWDENGKNFRAYGAMVTRLIMFFVMHKHIYDWYLFDSLHIENIFCIYILYFRWSRNIFCHSEILKTAGS